MDREGPGMDRRSEKVTRGQTDKLTNEFIFSAKTNLYIQSAFDPILCKKASVDTTENDSQHLDQFSCVTQYGKMQMYCFSDILDTV